MLDKLKAYIENIITTFAAMNDLTEPQVWGVCCGIGFVCAIVIMWII